MKILFITHRLPYPSVKHAGGYYQYSLIKELKSHNFSIDVLSFVNDEEYHHIFELKKEVNRVFTIPIRKNSLEKIFHLPLLFIFPRFVVQAWRKEMANAIKKILKNNQYDWVQCEYTQMAQYIRYIKNIPTSIMEHDISIIPVKRSYEKEKIFYKKLLKYITFILTRFFEPRYLKKFNLILVYSEKDKKYISKLVKNKNIFVLSPPIIINNEKGYNININKNNILFLGDLSRSPNIEAVLWFYNNVFITLKNEVQDVYFIIAGSNPSKEIINLNIDNNVRLIINFDKIEDVYNMAKLFVSPIFVGGGIIKKNLDALAIGCPVVTTRIGNEGINAPSPEAILIADDAESFKDAIKEICLNDSKRIKLSIDSKKFVMEKFNWNNSVELLIKEYKREIIIHSGKINYISK